MYINKMVKIILYVVVICVGVHQLQTSSTEVYAVTVLSQKAAKPKEQSKNNEHL